MQTLLHIDSSPLPNSVSRELSREFALAWQSAHERAEVIYRDLAAHPPPPIDAQWVAAVFTPAEPLDSDQVQKLALSDELIGELERADDFVIGVAMHNFSIPAVLKLWIDQIVRRGRTFAYGGQGPKGLLLHKKATVVVASGGVYDLGTPAASMNFVEPYLRAILAFIGVQNVQFITVGGTARMMSEGLDRSTFLKPALEAVRAAAAEPVYRP